MRPAPVLTRGDHVGTGSRRLGLGLNLGFAMAVGQTLGAKVGAGAAITHGAKLIRPLIVVVSCAIAARLLLAG